MLHPGLKEQRVRRRHPRNRGSRAGAGTASIAGPTTNGHNPGHDALEQRAGLLASPTAWAAAAGRVTERPRDNARRTSPASALWQCG